MIADNDAKIPTSCLFPFGMLEFSYTLLFNEASNNNQSRGYKEQSFIWGLRNCNLGHTDSGKIKRAFWGRERVRGL